MSWTRRLCAVVMVVAFMGVGEVQAIDLVFDGFCDGFSGGFVRRTADGQPIVAGAATGCATGLFLGTASGQCAELVTDFDSVGILWLYEICSDGTWTNYLYDGVSLFPLNSGTWSEGTPLAALGEGPASADF